MINRLSILAITVATANKNGLTAITRIMLIAKLRPDSSSPGPTIYRTSGSAKIMIKMLATKVARPS